MRNLVDLKLISALFRVVRGINSVHRRNRLIHYKLTEIEYVLRSGFFIGIIGIFSLIVAIVSLIFTIEKVNRLTIISFVIVMVIIIVIIIVYIFWRWKKGRKKNE